MYIGPLRRIAGKTRFFSQAPVLVAFAAALAGSASAAQAGPSATYMPLGGRMTPPAGFLDFCARKPGECGLKVEARYDATGAQARADTRATIFRKYMWAVAFGGGGQALASPTPAALWGPAPGAGGSAPEPSASGQETPAADPAGTGASLDGVEEARSAPTAIASTRDTLAELDWVNRQINGLIRYEPDIQAYGVADYWAEPLEAGGARVGDCEDYVLEKRRALIARGVPAAALSIAVVNTRRGEAHAVLLVDTDKGEMVLDSLSPWIVNWRDAPYQWVERQAPGAPMVWVAPGSGKGWAPTTIAAVDGGATRPAAG